MQQDAQKSEAHHATEDAVTSPANHTPDAATPRVETDHPDTADDTRRKSDRTEDRNELFPPDAEVRRDESDFGGPIELQVDMENPGDPPA